MARVLHLDDSQELRKQVRELLDTSEHQVISCSSEDEARSVSGPLDLFICGPLGKHSDGLIFALDKSGEGSKILILAGKRKFSGLPFFSTTLLSTTEGKRQLRQKIRQVLQCD